jgi:hypothetical protein
METGEIIEYVTKDFEEYDCESCNQNPYFNIKDCTPLPDCEECYTIIFTSDTTFKGHAFANKITGAYQINYTTGEFYGSYGGTMVSSLCELVLGWREKFPTIRTFSLEENKLKLYYNDQKKYLLFKKIKR